MLIEISDSTTDALIDEQPEVIRAIENLARARRQGHHVILASRDAAQLLGSFPGLSDEAQAVYQRVASRLSQKKSLYDTVALLVRLSAGLTEPRAIETGDKRVVEVPPSHFVHLESPLPPYLLSENINDAKTYHLAGEVFSVHSDMGNVPLRFSHRGGGGGTLYQEYDYIQSNCRRMCLCLADSDRQFPGDSLGSTGSDLLETESDQCPITEVHIISCREVENLIPVSLLIRLNNETDRGVPYPAGVISLIDSDNHDIVLHLDFRNGTKLGTLLSYPQGSDGEAYWNDRLDSFYGVHECDSECIQDGQCNSPSSCACTITSGFGRSVLNHFLDLGERMTPHKMYEALNSGEENLWLSVGELVFSWGCGTTRLSAL